MPETNRKYGDAPSRFWRVIFWLTAVHFAIHLLVEVRTIVPEAWNDSTVSQFHVHQLGVARATALWLFLNTNWVDSALCVADLAALYLAWNLAWWRPLKKTTFIYLACTLGVVAAYVASVTYLAMAGTIQTRNMTYVFERWLLPFAFVSILIYTLPAWLIFSGLLVLGWPRRKQGVCINCGYDLRVSPDRCPECGAAVPKKTEAAA